MLQPDDESKCVVCKSTLLQPRQYTGQDRFLYNCPQCGKFGFARTAQRLFAGALEKDPSKVAILSHALRKAQMTQEWPTWNTETCKQLLKTGELPTPQEQADNLVRWLGDNLPGPGESILVETLSGSAIIGAKSAPGFRFVVAGLLDDDLVTGELLTSGAGAQLTLTFDGWGRYEQLRRGVPSGWKAFMAMKYNDALLDRMVDDHFRPAVKQTGFTLRRLDDEPRAGLIDDRLRVEIQSARFVIVDLTKANYGAYWEAGYAEGLGKPVIYTCEKSRFRQDSHFDTNHHLHVLWTEAQITEAMGRLKATIRATIPEARREDA